MVLVEFNFNKLPISENRAQGINSNYMNNKMIPFDYNVKFIFIKV